MQRFARVVFAFLAGAACLLTDRGAAQEKLPDPLPPDLVAAWEKAGAKVGWMTVYNTGMTAWYSPSPRVGDIPAFRFSGWKDGTLAKLPTPERPFGLVLNFGVSDTGLKGIARFKQLQALDLYGTKVTGAGLKELAGLKQLQTLDLNGTQVTDAELKGIAGLTQLQTLNLSGLKVTDAGLKGIAGFTQLQRLTLIGTQVTDTGLKGIAGLTQLQRLDLSGTKVTDAGLKQLAGLTQLQRLTLMSTQVTDAGVAELQKSLPECKIKH